jgi:DNA helicase-2/ATP-dependent DNA helicase PcrA
MMGGRFKKEKFEFVYTILSRTSCILIITLFQNPDVTDWNTQYIFKEAIGLLRRDRIIFWDKETKDAFDLFCQDVQNGDLDQDDRKIDLS